MSPSEKETFSENLMRWRPLFLKSQGAANYPYNHISFPTDLSCSAPFYFILLPFYLKLFSFRSVLSSCSFSLRTGEQLPCPPSAYFSESNAFTSSRTVAVVLPLALFSVVSPVSGLSSTLLSKTRKGWPKLFSFSQKAPWSGIQWLGEFVVDQHLAFSVEDSETQTYQAQKLVIKAEFNSEKYSCHLAEYLIYSFCLSSLSWIINASLFAFPCLSSSFSFIPTL